MNIVITRPAPDGLSETHWHFWVTDRYHGHRGIAAVLQSYSLLQRPTTRHKFRPTEVYDRLNHRGRYRTDIKDLDAAPEIPPSVRMEVTRNVTESFAIIAGELKQP